MSRARALIIAALGALALGLGLGIFAWNNAGHAMLSVLSPKGSFADEPRPAAPDYADPAAWSALPSREDAGDGAPIGSPAIVQNGAPADVFYVHPTTYIGPTWSGPIEDPAVVRATDHGATGIQATAFNACCAVWAPRYRQATLTAFLRPSADGDAAIDLAYSDVLRAFAAFQQQRGSERPFFLVAHSQGSVHAARLLAEEIAPGPARDQLIAAYIVGGVVPREGVGGLSACQGPDETGCLIAWNARGPGYTPSAFELHRRGDARPLLCTNPLTWHTDDGAPASANLGAVFLDSDDHQPRLAFADASCEGDWLVVRAHGQAPRDLPSRILDHVIGDDDLHPIEFQLYYMNLRQNAGARLAAWQARGG